MPVDANLTDLLARILGLYMLAAGIGTAGGYDIPRMMAEMRDSPFAYYLAGLMAFAVGATITALHTDFTGPIAALVTLIGWAALAEGIVMLAFPNMMLRFSDTVCNAIVGRTRPIGVAVAVLGGALLVVTLI